MVYWMTIENSIESLLSCSLGDSVGTRREAGFVTDIYLKSSRWFTSCKGKDKRFSFSVIAGSLLNIVAYTPWRGGNIYPKPLLTQRIVNIVSQYTEYQLGLDSYVNAPFCDALSARIIQTKGTTEKPEVGKHSRSTEELRWLILTMQSLRDELIIASI